MVGERSEISMAFAIGNSTGGLFDGLRRRRRFGVAFFLSAPSKSIAGDGLAFAGSLRSVAFHRMY